jgi:hypothetical protein
MSPSKNRTRVVTTFAFALCAPLASWAAPNMEDGDWEVTARMEMPGMPFAMPPVKHHQCMTKKDLVPDMSKKDGDCVVKDQKITGDTVSWRMQCNDKNGAIDGEGKITYAGKSYTGVMQAKMTDKRGEANVIKYNFTGKHMGPCDPNAKKKLSKPGDY